MVLLERLRVVLLRLLRAVKLGAVPVLALLLTASPSSPAAEARRMTPAEFARHIRIVKQIQRDLALEGARRRLADARLRRPRGSGAKPASGDLNPAAVRSRRLPRPASGEGALSIPVNVKANLSAGDASNATQSEECVAAWGNYVLVAWNDGQGSSTGGAYQGYAYSTNGGATFVDGGDPPKPATHPNFRWTSDPVVAVNEKTGTFYYCAMATTSASQNGLALARGAFSGGVFVWSDVAVVREESNSTAFLDKPWLAADSSGAGTYVYLANVTYTLSGNKIDFYRSTDGGTSWSNGSRISAPGDNGYVQAPRVAVGPGGEVHTLWLAIGQGVAEDFLRYRTSTNHGQHFGSEVTATDQISNFSTGAPGFNRQRGMHFPSLAVDRTLGPYRGRIYAAWSEAYNFQNDPFGTTGNARVEMESNDFTAAATPFTSGDVLRGTTASVTPPDADYWSFPLAAGQSIIVWADSLPASQTYSLRVFAAAPDSTQSLCYAGDGNPGASVNQAFFTFTAPVTATWFLRMIPFDPAAGSQTGPYRISTAPGVRDAERGRDQRDVFVCTSDDGVTWSTPVRVNDDPVGFDNDLADVGVGADGFPHVMWFDFRDDPFGSRAHHYLARSTDGGATWAPSVRITSAQTNWTATGSNLAPNMGDYSHLWSDERWIHAAWADGRDGSADVYTARADTRHGVTACARDSSAPPGAVVDLVWEIANDNALFANSYTASLANARNWPMPAPSGFAVPALGTAEHHVLVPVPDTAVAGPNALTLTVSNASGTFTQACATALTVTSNVGVGGGAPVAFALMPSVPNPASGHARLDYALPEATRIGLRIYGPRGELIRTLVEGERPAGLHSVTWDGRDERGRLVRTGIYFYRLEGLGRNATRRLVWFR